MPSVTRARVSQAVGFFESLKGSSPQSSGKRASIEQAQGKVLQASKQFAVKSPEGERELRKKIAKRYRKSFVESPGSKQVTEVVVEDKENAPNHAASPKTPKTPRGVATRTPPAQASSSFNVDGKLSPVQSGKVAKKGLAVQQPVLSRSAATPQEVKVLQSMTPGIASPMCSTPVLPLSQRKVQMSASKVSFTACHGAGPDSPCRVPWRPR